MHVTLFHWYECPNIHGTSQKNTYSILLFGIGIVTQIHLGSLLERIRYKLLSTLGRKE